MTPRESPLSTTSPTIVITSDASNTSNNHNEITKLATKENYNDLIIEDVKVESEKLKLELLKLQNTVKLLTNEIQVFTDTYMNQPLGKLQTQQIDMELSANFRYI